MATQAKVNWFDIGYGDGMKWCTNSLASMTYPTQDVNTPEDERLYLEGQNSAVRDFYGRSFNTAAAYISEHYE